MSDEPRQMSERVAGALKLYDHAPCSRCQGAGWYTGMAPDPNDPNEAYPTQEQCGACGGSGAEWYPSDLLTAEGAAALHEALTHQGIYIGMRWNGSRNWYEVELSNRRKSAMSRNHGDTIPEATLRAASSAADAGWLAGGGA